jgi:hypothetical protein
LAKLWGDSKRAEDYLENAEKLRGNIRRNFWCTDRKAFVNGFDRKGDLDEKITPYAQIFAILFGLVNEEEAKLLADRYICASDRKQSCYSMSKYWEYLAVAKVKRADFIVKELKHAWGEMVERGYVRFFEDIRPGEDEDRYISFYGRPFGCSLCSCWSGAVPVVSMLEGVLGIAPLAPGFEKCRIRPFIGDLRWIEGTVPTPKGIIRLELGDGGKGRLILPEGIEAYLEGICDVHQRTVLQGPGDFPISAL